ncbi:MAG: hypothetical protein ACFHU9_00295 [Fluviicola sp.]
MIRLKIYYSHKITILGCSALVLVLLLSCSRKVDKNVNETVDEPQATVVHVAIEYRTRIDSDFYLEKRFTELKKVKKNDTLIYKYYTDSIYVGNDSILLTTKSRNLRDNCLVLKVYNDMRVLRIEEFQTSLKNLDTRVHYILLDSFRFDFDSEKLTIYHYTTSSVIDNKIGVKEDLYFSTELGLIASLPKVNRLSCAVLSDSDNTTEQMLGNIIKQIEIRKEGKKSNEPERN